MYNTFVIETVRTSHAPSYGCSTQQIITWMGIQQTSRQLGEKDFVTGHSGYRSFMFTSRYSKET